MKLLYLRPDFRQAFANADDSFDRVMSLDGQIVRQMDGRRTLRFELANRGYYLKAHNGIGWKEVFKNLVSLKLPILGARNEWRAIQRLQQIGIATTPLVGYGQRGLNPARQQSFVITEEISGIVSLESLCAGWREHPPRGARAIRRKRWLLAEVARNARLLHESGINHRDFYLCHFCLQEMSAHREWGSDSRPRLYLLDLHRAQIRRRTPRRSLVKDLGGLYFSAMDIGLTKRDRLRFIACYRGQSWGTVLADEQTFWLAVRRRALSVYRSFHDHPPPPGC